MNISFPEKITNYALYNDVLPQLSQYYLAGNTENPILSFMQTEWINYESIPILIGIIDIIYNVNRKKVFLDFAYHPHFLYILEHSYFFRYINKYGFAEYDTALIGGFSTYIENDYRDVHVMHAYEPITEYINISELEEQLRFRAMIYENMRYHIIPVDYNAVLQDIISIGEQETDIYKTLLGELITNARLYSLSRCYALFHTDKYKTIMSICDVGSGFSNSLEVKRKSELYPYNKQEEYRVLKEALIKQYNKYEINDFFDIMEILFYSEMQDRINLSYLKRLIVNNRGVLRLHSNSTQIIFSYKRCQNCQNDIMSCLECLLKNITYDNYYSPVKIYNSKLKGVRLEIEFRR